MPINYTPPTLVAGTDHKTDAGGSTKINVAFMQAIVNALNAAADGVDTIEAEFAERVRDYVAAALVAGANVTITPDDGADTITIAASGGSGSVAWGAITGTLSSQTDLQNALNGKITAFADPNADRIVFWDDSAGAYAALSTSSPLSISGTAMSVGTATTGATGVSELATGAETITGTDTSRVITPDGHRDTWGLYYGINPQTGTTYAPVLEDQGKLVTLNNASAITVTLPSNTTTAFPIGTVIDFAVIGAGMASFVAGSGATKLPTASMVSRIQGSVVSCIKYTTNEWLVVGDVA